MRTTQPFLTDREREVLILVAQGRRHATIAEILAISEVTVRNHLANSRRKLGARNRPHMVMRALLVGEISLDEMDDQDPS